MITSTVIGTELRSLVSDLMKNNLAFYSNSISYDRSRVSWHPSVRNSQFLEVGDESNVETYLSWLRNGHYTILLKDFALIQVTYHLANDRAVGHRLAYIPCPFSVNSDLYDGEMLFSDFVELHMGNPEKVLMRSPIRFDFDPYNARKGHPESHLTINSSDCRIACASPLRIGRFFNFVYRNFYPSLYRQHQFLQELNLDGWFPQTIAPDDKLEMHVNW